MTVDREQLIDLLSDWFENKVYGFHDTGHATIKANWTNGEPEFDHFALAEAIAQHIESKK